MNESILESIKKPLGIMPEYTDFDNDIIMFINTIFPILRQIGCGPIEGFMITDSNTKWSDYLGEENHVNLQNVKTFIYLKVKLLFDPPAASAHMTAITESIKELEWRIKEECEFNFSITEYVKPTDKEDDDE